MVRMCRTHLARQFKYAMPLARDVRGVAHDGEQLATSPHPRVQRTIERIMAMTPTSEGVWLWRRKDDQREFHLPIYNVGAPLGELTLRVYFLGNYYDVEELTSGGSFIAKSSHNPNGAITPQRKGWVHPNDFNGTDDED